MNLFAVLTRIDGRISRKPFWIGSLLILGATITAAFAIMAVWGETALDGPSSGNSLSMIILGWVMLLASIPIIVKRLHDLNRSGHFLWPIIGLEVLISAGDLSGMTGNETDLNALGWVLAAIYGVYALAFIIYVGFYRGTDGRNKFGPDPLASEEIPATVNL